MGALARRVAARAVAGDIILLSGPLGAGKTVFARAFVRARVGADIVVPSPSFTLVQAYEAADLTIYHFDLWRLEGADFLTEIGWDEAAEGIRVVEWPERLGSFDEAALRVTISVEGDSRRVECQGEERWFA